MIARFDHRPMLTALLALTTTVLFVVVIRYPRCSIQHRQRQAPQATVAEATPVQPRLPRIWTQEAKTTDGTFKQSQLSPLRQATLL
jgi:hypothetical protein